MTKSQLQETQLSVLTKDNSEKDTEIARLSQKLAEVEKDYGSVRKSDEVWRGLMAEQYLGAKEKLESMLRAQRPLAMKEGLGYTHEASTSTSKSSKMLADRFVRGKVQVAESTPQAKNKQKMLADRPGKEKATESTPPPSPTPKFKTNAEQEEFDKRVAQKLQDELDYERQLEEEAQKAKKKRQSKVRMSKSTAKKILDEQKKKAQDEQAGSDTDNLPLAQRMKNNPTLIPEQEAEDRATWEATHQGLNLRRGDTRAAALRDKKMLEDLAKIIELTDKIAKEPIPNWKE